ncbi:suppressor of abi3-5 [Rhynchospora pubera]|uniref:Suppressor of abi3-5 n=1 Tax=Rhynchospora pubera TaxID=906938 RepID=A0AAV8FG72_9POAL|nr:suppressor of abi3-5 [Rhynchospora pubera]
MEPRRYVIPHGWDNNYSAPEGYGAIPEPDFRVGSSYNGDRIMDERFPRDHVYPRNVFDRPMHERDLYARPPPVAGAWPDLRRDFDDEYKHMRDSRRRDSDRYRDAIYESGSSRDYGLDRNERRGSRDRDYRGSHDRDYGRNDSDYERGRRDDSWRGRGSRERRGSSRERDESPHRRRDRVRSRSRGREERSRSRSRSPRGRSHGRGNREDSYDEYRRERSSDRYRDHYFDERNHADSSVVPSATMLIRGLSSRTTEDDLYQALAEWGPLRHVRVIRERGSGISRGFAFVDLPSVEDATRMLSGVREKGVVVDGRRLLFDYSREPDNASRLGFGGHRSIAPPSDWICAICGCLNFARRALCFQCNEPRTEEATPAEAASSANPSGKKGADLGATHVLVVRGLDENADEEMLRYEFAKYAPVKDLRLVRDRFTHVSKGFAFVHFNSIEDATKALEATNGTTLEKNGQLLRVAFAKNIHGPGAAPSQSSSLAAAAIEAAAFSQQYDAVGWTPKEYNPENSQPSNANTGTQQTGTSAVQTGFVWDEKSGYYYDAASGFYYDGNTGLYYDGNAGVWYSYDQQTQQYAPCDNHNNANGNPTGELQPGKESGKPSEGNKNKKVIISAPAQTVKSDDNASLPDAVKAAASAALAAEKKEKEKAKEIKFASKNSLLANKKKMNNVLNMWKQRNQETQVQPARVVVDDKEPKTKSEFGGLGLGNAATVAASIEPLDLDSQVRSTPQSVSSASAVTGVVRGSAGRGIIKSDTTFGAPSGAGSEVSLHTPFKTDASALGSLAPSSSASTGRRRFSEAPVQSINRDQSQAGYRDRAAERRSLYGSSSSKGDELSDPTSEYSSRKGSTLDMPFPPGVGVRSTGEAPPDTESYEVITADRALDESNVGNRILRNMGWQEGLGLGKDGGGIKEPVQAKAAGDRSGLGSQQRKVDPLLEAQAGDSYRTIIQKKAIARFREMS